MVKLNYFRETGQIRCRFEDRSDNLRNLGACLTTFQSHSFQPYFTTTEEYYNSGSLVPITNDIIREMKDYGTFSVEEPIIHISTQVVRTTIALVLRPGEDQVPISGFPRQLGYEDEISCRFSFSNSLPRDLG